MDKNQITGIALISVIFIAYFVWFAPDKKEIQSELKIAQTDSSSVTNKAINESVLTAKLSDSTAQLSDSILDVELTNKYGVFAAAISTENKIEEIKTKNLTLRFASKGGNIISAELNNYLTFDKKPLILVDESNYKNDITFETQNGKKISLNELNFSLLSSDDSTIKYEANLGNGKKVIRSYTINNELYTIAHNIKFVGLANEINGNTISYSTVQDLKHLEKSMTECRRKGVINYYTVEEDYDFIRGAKAEPETENLENISWISFKQSFFSAGIITNQTLKNQSFNNVVITSATDEESKYVKRMEMTMSLPLNELSSEMGYSYSYYFGPNEDAILEQIAEGFDKNIDFGWPVLREVNKYFIYPLFRFLAKYISNIGLVILLLVFIIKGLLLPLTYSSQVGMAKMKVLKPEIDALNEKHKDDKTKAQTATMGLYKEFGVNPMSGCIPMFLQMPILFAMFRLFPNIIELRQRSFLWADDLSSYDTLFSWTGMDFFPLSFLDGHISMFTLLMTVSTVAYTHFNNQITTQTQPGMKTMSYMMPFIFFFVLNSYAAGLTYYYFLSNLFSIGQQVGIRKFVDDTKIRLKLEANKVKNATKGKSSFQNTLSHAMKKQQDKAAAKKNKK